MGFARLQLRGDTAAAWTSANPVLAERELALETDTGQFKVGDGTTVWTALGYGGIVGPPGTQGEPGAAGVSTVAAHAGTTYTVLAADVSIYRRMTASTTKTVTVGPESGQALPANYEQHFDNDGAGAMTFVAGSGVTIKPPAGGSLIVPQNGVVTLKRLATNVFRLVGITESP